MKHVRQTNLLPGKGDCFSACVSMVTGIPLEDIPVFTADDNKEWWSDTLDWLKPRGWVGVLVTGGAWDGGATCLASVTHSGVPLIVTAQSPRHACLHSVVWKGGKQYDPHPDGAGVSEPFTDLILLIPVSAYAPISISSS